MAAPEIKRVLWVTVKLSETVTRPEGTNALCLHTNELGPIAFAVDQRAIDAIRGTLSKIELGLRPSQGQA